MCVCHVGVFVFERLMIVELLIGMEMGMVSDCECMACRCNSFLKDLMAVEVIGGMGMGGRL